MKKLILAFAASALVGATVTVPFMTGCTTLNPATGQHEFDPAKTDKVKAAVEGTLAIALRRVVSADSEAYLRTVGTVFCQMSSSGQFDPVFVADAVDRSTADLQGRADPLLIDAKDLLLVLYKINYADRFKYDLSGEKWPKNVADVVCTSIDQALKDSGRPGVK